jgi:hypothetical protein
VEALLRIVEYALPDSNTIADLSQAASKVPVHGDFPIHRVIGPSLTTGKRIGVESNLAPFTGLLAVVALALAIFTAKAKRREVP